VTRIAEKRRGYDYGEFVRAVEQLHGTGCFVVRAINARLRAGTWRDSMHLVQCDGILDGEHVLSKQRVQDRFPFGAVMRDGALEPLDRGVWEEIAKTIDGRGRLFTLGELLNDGRLGVLACRRHHDLIENGQFKFARAELPVEVESVAVDYGLDAWLERDYGGR
jgi:hypothetical protein